MNARPSQNLWRAKRLLSENRSKKWKALFWRKQWQWNSTYWPVSNLTSIFRSRSLMWSNTSNFVISLTKYLTLHSKDVSTWFTWRLPKEHTIYSTTQRYLRRAYSRQLPISSWQGSKKAFTTGCMRRTWRWSKLTLIYSLIRNELLKGNAWQRGQQPWQPQQPYADR